RDLESVLGAYAHLLTPVGVAEARRIELEKVRQQAPESLFRLRAQLPPGGAEELRQSVRAQRDPGHHPPAAAATTLQRPVKLGLRAGVHGAHATIRGHYLRLEESRSGAAEALGETAEAAALHETGDAHRGATPTLHVAARAAADGIVQIDPHGAGAG